MILKRKKKCYQNKKMYSWTGVSNCLSTVGKQLFLGYLPVVDSASVTFSKGRSSDVIQSIRATT